MKIEASKFYVNGRGDVCGPMEERTPGVWLDQYGGVYHPNGMQWNHIEGSTANLIDEANEKNASPTENTEAETPGPHSAGR